MAFKPKVKAIKSTSPAAKLRSKLRTTKEIAKVKSEVADVKHKQKLQKLERQKIENELKSQKRLAKPKEVRRRADRDFQLKKLEAKREVDVINAKNRWKNTLAAGVTGTSTIDTLKNEDGKSIQKEIEDVLAGPAKPSIPQSNNNNKGK